MKIAECIKSEMSRQHERSSTFASGLLPKERWRQILRLPLIQAIGGVLAASVLPSIAGNVTLAWDPSESAALDRNSTPPLEGTNIVWQGSSQTPGVWSVRHELPREAVGIRISGLQPGSKYNFVVQYGNATGWSDFSNMVAFQIPAGPAVTGPISFVPVLSATPPGVVTPPVTPTGGTSPTEPPTTPPTETPPDTTTGTTTETAWTPPRLIIEAQNGGAKVQVLGEVGQKIQVHFCNDLSTQNWVVKAEVTLGVDAQFTFTSNDSEDGEVKFFRAMVVGQ